MQIWAFGQNHLACGMLVDAIPSMVYPIKKWVFENKVTNISTISDELQVVSFIWWSSRGLIGA